MESTGLRKVLGEDFITIMGRIKKAGKEKEINPEKPMLKIALLGTGSLQYFAMILKYCLQISEIQSYIFIGNYNGMEMDVMDEKSEYNSFHPDITVLFTGYREIQDYPPMYAANEKIWEMVWQEIGRYEMIWDRIFHQNGSCILQTNFVIPIERKMGNLEGNYSWSHQTYLELLNYGMKIKKKKYVTLLDFEYLASVEGKRKWFDFPNYYLNKSNMSYDCLPLAVEEVALQIMNYCGIMRKCIVLDLDQTIWGGILEEAGVQNVNIFPDDPIGEAFLDFQKYLKGLKERGIILAVCSKNDEEYAKEVFIKNQNMILKLEDISCFVANWENKVENIRSIADTLNIGLNSIVFVDDNPVERDLVRQVLPEVEVIELSDDPANYVLDMEHGKYFEWLSVTEEDIGRTSSYKAEEKMKSIQANFDSYEDYLNSLSMEGVIEQINSDSTSRTVQLFNKTNQFNTTRYRLTEAKLLKLIEEGRIVLTCNLKDKFAQYGMISCAILRIEDKNCIVEAWAMSCRVFKRTVEEFMLNKFIKTALEHGCSKLSIAVLPNERNTMIPGILEEKGFQKSAEADNPYVSNIEEGLEFKNYIKNDKNYKVE